MNAFFLALGCQLCALAALQYRAGLRRVLLIALPGWVIGSAALYARADEAGNFWLYETIFSVAVAALVGPLRWAFRQMERHADS